MRPRRNPNQTSIHIPTSKEAQATNTLKTKTQGELKDKSNLVNSDFAIPLQKGKDCDLLSEEQENEFKKKRKKNGSWKGDEKKSMTSKNKKSLEKIWKKTLP